jgi:fatty acid synthase, animal type
MQNDMNSGVIKPLKTSVFDASEVEQAFRFLASGKHIGKVLVKIRENEESCESLPINVEPRISFNPNHCYVVPGGLGGVGMEFSDWLIMRECKKLVLSSSRGISSSYQSYRIKLVEL